MLARALAVTRLDLSRSLARSPYSAQNDLSQSLRSLSPRGVDVSFCRHPNDESSLDRRVVTRPTSRHSTDESSLDRFVVTRPFCRHSIDESSLDRRVLTRPFCHHSTVLSSLGAEHSLASICTVAWLDLSRSLDLFFAVTRLAVTQIARKSRA
ncbi:hypothetical protein F2Q68_00043183 [Brassica cretica]|uniref:Uncharacterized protein n=1 Tax=Brassica cretica TaxID=69181 RepID=A0A8S9LR17_BRACR|nr:hypothetical protein F2Q68_00043183 [Brassica cretica]